MTKQLFMRTTDKDGRSYGGFQWPLEVGATVEAPDWNPDPVCGGGLHGLLNGEGDSYMLSCFGSALWWIVEAEGAVDLGGKHKFPRCKVVAVGSREEITGQIKSLTGAAVHFVSLTGGDRATLTGGNWATLTGGDRATLTGGYGATLTGGDLSTLRGGDGATLTGGAWATLTGGDWATLTGGDWAALIFTRMINGRRRVLVAYVGEDGVKPNTPYRANADFTGVEEVNQ